MVELKLRKATVMDEPSIFRLIREGNINPLGLKWQRFVVIESPQQKVIACGQIKPHQDGSQELASLTVDKAWRGQGLARRIIEHFLEIHHAPLYLMCEAGLQSFYEKFGFHAIEGAELPPYFRRIKRLLAIPERLHLAHILIMLRDPQ